MRGHITKRGKDSYTIILNLGRDPSTGKRKQQWISVKGTKKNAEKKLAELLHQLDTGMFMKPGKTTVADYLQKWLTDYVWPNLAPRTAEGYEHIVRRHLVPALGNLPLTQLKPEHLQHYYSQKLASGRSDGKGGLSAKTVRHHHITLHGALRAAVQWGLLVRNPAEAVSAPRTQRREMQIWSEGELNHFLDAASDSEYYAIFYIALFTGMRRSEVLALRWSDVDLVYSQIYVSRGMHHLRDGTTLFTRPKTAKGNRTIALPPSAALTLADYRREQESLHLLAGTPLTDDSLVFSHLDGTPLLPDTITHAWAKLVRRAGIRAIRLHDARHTHASLMLKQGIHPKIVQERLGHASIQVTLDTYSHVAPGLQEAAAEAFDKVLAGSQRASSPNAARSPR